VVGNNVHMSAIDIMVKLLETEDKGQHFAFNLGIPRLCIREGTTGIIMLSAFPAAVIQIVVHIHKHRFQL